MSGLFWPLIAIVAPAYPVIAMPAGIFPIAVTRLHQGSVPTALQVVLATSVVSVVTIPMWIGIGMWWVLGRG